MEKQRTIKRQATIRGIGLQTGRPVTLRLKAAPPDRGIVFVRTDLPGAPSIEVNPFNLKEPGRTLQRTVIKNKKAEVHTVEHLLASLSGLFVDNIIIEIDNVEVPGLDGSARGFAKILRDAGFHEQDAPRAFIEIERPLICSDGKASIQVLPDERFRVEYFMDYDHPLLKEQWFDIELRRSDDFLDFFENNVAPSRTFCMEQEALVLLNSGLGKGADLNNTLVIGNDGPLENKFRFPDEPARHKLLDFLGDLYILGRHIKGRVIAKKSGHRLNNIFVKRLQEECSEKLVKI
ncbi:UDP-3-O-acyl-N-acetylglucosamine deacetylase [Omnitrophica bacterium]|nr:UDP-3-O-acyl-N-acetylglucosamine deacetylase [Candidatus Omnitrophota bacterium]